eukprot:TRINITY_DN9103_c0_g4_i1.p1 TRINITY_DN9103_c0_g4~~TRINITY_DN9103_c0_g4_i1.p1  ORF type:complete len:104 (+),score=5.71 TRINITY_DN9103_c0_g4_i1:874-1185(+)
MFMCAHVANYSYFPMLYVTLQLIFAMQVGILYSLIYYHTRSLSNTILLHIGNNIIATFIPFDDFDYTSYSSILAVISSLLLHFILIKYLLKLISNNSDKKAQG